MKATRRSLLAAGLALPVAAAGQRAPGQVAAIESPARLWSSLFAGPVGETFCWWRSGTLYAHVDRLREFPVAGVHALMICRTSRAAAGLALDFRTIGYFSDLDSGAPTEQWLNPFTDVAQSIPSVFVEGPGRYTMAPAPDGMALGLVADKVRTNRIVATAEAAGQRPALTQIEGTLQGFPTLAGGLPPLDSPLVTERQTRIQLIAPSEALRPTRGYFSHVYDALPPWLGFGEALGSGLVKGQMRKADAIEVVDRAVWAQLRRTVPSAFAGDRLVLE